METVQIKLETKIVQENETENFVFEEEGTLASGPKGFMLKYKENGQIPVRLVVKDEQVVLSRGVMPNDYSKMTFISGQKTAVNYVSGGRQMELEVSTKNVLVEEIDENSQQIIVEYDLYTGLYLVGNYIFKLIFNK